MAMRIGQMKTKLGIPENQTFSLIHDFEVSAYHSSPSLIPQKAKDPETNGDAALIKTGTKQQPNGAWKQQSSTDPKSKGTGRIFFAIFFFVNESY